VVQWNAFNHLKTHYDSFGEVVQLQLAGVVSMPGPTLPHIAKEHTGRPSEMIFLFNISHANSHIYKLTVNVKPSWFTSIFMAKMCCNMPQANSAGGGKIAKTVAHQHGMVRVSVSVRIGVRV